MLVRAQKQTLSPGRLVKPLVILCVLFYLCYHALHGDRGLYALMRERTEREHLQAELASTRAERQRMELRVSHLRDGSLDLDLLDEQMRRMLGVMKPGEIVVMDGNAD